MIILLFFLVVVDLFIVSKQRQQLLNEVHGHLKEEIALISVVVREPLLMHDYAMVEQFMIQWARENSKILQVKAVMPNKFELVNYSRSEPAQHIYEIQQQIQYSGKNLINIKVIADFTSGMTILNNLQFQLVAASILLTIILGTAVWVAFKIFALSPLESEIGKCEQAEHMLQKVNDELEIRVNKRTAKLENANKSLLGEIDNRRKAEEMIMDS
jgi:C4-dicarboxylate-specific signal transduction histidine kinase